MGPGNEVKPEQLPESKRTKPVPDPGIEQHQRSPAGDQPGVAVADLAFAAEDQQQSAASGDPLEPAELPVKAAGVSGKKVRFPFF